MTALVTGATGFLGGALVAELLAGEQAVRVLVRDQAKARRRFGETVEIVPGDIGDGCAVRRAVDGADIVYHLAGCLYRPEVAADVYRRTHVNGVRTLLEACREDSRLRRLVHVSTTGVHGVTGDVPAGEEAPFAPTNPYEATKLEGELLALRAFRERGLPVSVARPGLVYGPGDLHLLGFFASIDRGLFHVIDGGRALLHPVYVDDVISALLRCAENPAAVGRTYNIAGRRPVSVHELATAAAHALGRELPRGSIPRWLAHLASDVFAVTPGLRGERSPLTASRVEFLTRSRVYDIRRARTELGYVPRIELEDGMRLTVDWYRGHGYLDGSAASRSGAR